MEWTEIKEYGGEKWWYTSPQQLSLLTLFFPHFSIFFNFTIVVTYMLKVRGDEV